METVLQYRLLQDRLKKEILSGVYKIGDLLPSENELCAVANLARSTVRQALSQLEREGYIVKKKGKGSIVTSRRRALGLLNFQGFSASVTGASITTLSVQVPVLSPWPEDFYFPISENEKNAGCISFSRVRCIEKDPVMWETSCLPNLNLPKFTRNFKVQHSFFDFLAREYQIEITGMEQEIRAVSAGIDVTKHLKIKKGAAVLLIHRKYRTNRPYLSVYSTLYCNTEKYAMSHDN